MNKRAVPHPMPIANRAHRPFIGLRWATGAALVAALGVAMCTTGMQARAAVTAAWQLQMPPNPTGATSAAFAGVSCPATDECIAVGSASLPAGLHTLAERWNGSTWSILTTPNPGSDGDWLNAVSCPSTTVCIAVGATGANTAGTQYGLVERWNGSVWSATRINPGVGGAAVFDAVSCSSASACTAVGYAYSCCDPETFTVADRWNGSSWSLQTTPVLDCGCASLTGVSCPTATVCTASSFGGGSDLDMPLTERWTGGTWLVGSSQPPTPGSEDGGLNSVSCPSATACTAVGYYYTNPGDSTFAALSDHWNGSTWAVQTQPSSGKDLTSVSCPTTSACTAIGITNADGVFASHWNGTHWVAQTVPTSGTSSDKLNAVDCASATACMAVGSYVSGTEEVTLAERYS